MHVTLLGVVCRTVLQSISISSEHLHNFQVADKSYVRKYVSLESYFHQYTKQILYQYIHYKFCDLIYFIGLVISNSLF